MALQIDTQALKRTYPIAEVVARYGIDLRPSGRALIGRCPFHDDGGRPNLHVYECSDSWYCYRCAVGGDVISFVEQMEHVGFREAVERIAGGCLRARATASRRGGSAAHARRWEGACSSRSRRASLPCRGHRALPEPLPHRLRGPSPTARARGLDRETLERHRVGYSTGDELADYLRWRKTPPPGRGQGRPPPTGQPRLPRRADRAPRDQARAADLAHRENPLLPTPPSRSTSAYQDESPSSAGSRPSALPRSTWSRGSSTS